MDEALDSIREAARQQEFTSRDLHVATTGFDWSLLRDSTSNMSLFAERRIVELRLPTGKPGRAGSQAIVDLIEQLGSDLMLIVVTPKLDRSSQSAKWVKALDAAGVNVTIWPIGPRELPGWIAQRMRNAGLQPDREAVTMIADRVEGNLLAAGQEIEKLRLLHGEGKVSADDVSSAVANSSRFDVFKLVDAALGGDAKRSMKVLAGLRAEGVEPVIIVWALDSGIADPGKSCGAAGRGCGSWRRNAKGGCLAQSSGVSSRLRCAASAAAVPSASQSDRRS